MPMRSEPVSRPCARSTRYTEKEIMKESRAAAAARHSFLLENVFNLSRLGRFEHFFLLLGRCFLAKARLDSVDNGLDIAESDTGYN